MARTLDLTQPVRNLIIKYPELKNVMVSIGFSDIAKPIALDTVGRVITIPKGCAIKGLSLTTVIGQLEQAGFEVVGYHSDDSGSAPQLADSASEPQSAASMSQPLAPTSLPQSANTNRIDQLKGYIRRLSRGDDLESVRSDFVAHFSDVDASEIMSAEQALIAEGAPLDKVSRLCDVHSALFHGLTHEETDKNGTDTHDVSRAQSEKLTQDAKDNMSTTHITHVNTSEADKGEANADITAASLEAIPGHPLNVLARENEAIATQIREIREAQTKGDIKALHAGLLRLRQISYHYTKKGDLLYPLLATRYNITGPSNVMWTVDDEIRSELAMLATHPQSASWDERLQQVLDRAEEMIYKEANILFPLCAANFTTQEWREMAHDLMSYPPCLIDKILHWEEELPAGQLPQTTHDVAASGTAVYEHTIALPSGHFTVAQLRALLNTIPAEITFVDTDDTNCYFNEGPKEFKRPLMALNRSVFACHPPKIGGMVHRLIDEFRSGRQDSFEVWHTKGDKDLLVRYLAIRDDTGTYVGTLEFVEDLSFARKHFQSKKSRDEKTQDH